MHRLITSLFLVLVFLLPGTLQGKSQLPGKAASGIGNFAVANHHTYFAGPGGVWVHNVCEKRAPVFAGRQFFVSSGSLGFTEVCTKALERHSVAFDLLMQMNRRNGMDESAAWKKAYDDIFDKVYKDRSFAESKGVAQHAAQQVVGYIASKSTPKMALWNEVDAFERGKVIEAALIHLDYKGWFNVGQLHRGYFPLVDFQQGQWLVSIKSLNTQLPTYANGAWLERGKTYINLLVNRANVNNHPGIMRLDLRVDPDVEDFDNIVSQLVQYGSNLDVDVRVKRFPE